MAKDKYGEAEIHFSKALGQTPDDYTGLVMMSKCQWPRNIMQKPNPLQKKQKLSIHRRVRHIIFPDLPKSSKKITPQHMKNLNIMKNYCQVILTLFFLRDCLWRGCSNQEIG